MKIKFNIKNINFKSKTFIIWVVAIVLAITAVVVVVHKHSTVKTDTKPVVVDTKGETSEVVKDGVEGPKYKITAIDGYTSYIIKYIDPTGNPINMTTTVSLLRDGNSVYNGLQEAKEKGLFKDYYDSDGMCYFQLKTGATFAWTITPTDKAAIPTWKDSKSGVPIAINATKEKAKKIIEKTIILDYSKDVVQPTLNETGN